MKKMVAGCVVVLALAFAGGAVLSVVGPSAVAYAAEKTQADKAPDFTVVDGNGKKVRFLEKIGKPIVLNFWASWCPPCRDEMSLFQAMHTKLGDSVVFMMVNLTDGSNETLSKAKDFIRNGKYSFPVYFDVGSEAAIIYGLESIPTTVFIDKNGYIASGFVGGIDQATFEEALQDITGEAASR